MTIVRAVLLRAALLAGGWWILIEADRAGVAFGVPIVTLALFTSLWLSPPTRQSWRPIALVRFVAHFVLHSVLGAVDVARRAFTPRLLLTPNLRTFRGRLPPGAARDVFAGALSMMPGTLVVNRDDDALLVHTLVDSEAVDRELGVLEERVANAMGSMRERRDG